MQVETARFVRGLFFSGTLIFIGVAASDFGNTMSLTRMGVFCFFIAAGFVAACLAVVTYTNYLNGTPIRPSRRYRYVPPAARQMKTYGNLSQAHAELSKNPPRRYDRGHFDIVDPPDNVRSISSRRHAG